MTLDIFSLFLIFCFSSFFVYLICDIKKLNFKLTNYLKAIQNLTGSFSSDISKDKDFQKKLDAVSLEGIKLIASIFVFLAPYLLFLSIIIFYKYNGSIFFLTIFPALPYIILIRNR